MTGLLPRLTETPSSVSEHISLALFVFHEQWPAEWMSGPTLLVLHDIFSYILLVPEVSLAAWFMLIILFGTSINTMTFSRFYTSDSSIF
jgi:hypothetical protein